MRASLVILFGIAAGTAAVLVPPRLIDPGNTGHGGLARTKITFTVWGMTEVGGVGALSYLDSDVAVRTTMSGWPLSGYEIKVVDPVSGISQPPGELGEICFRGYTVMQGYYNKPDETARTVDAECWLHGAGFCLSRRA